MNIQIKSFTIFTVILSLCFLFLYQDATCQNSKSRQTVTGEIRDTSSYVELLHSLSITNPNILHPVFQPAFEKKQMTESERFAYQHYEYDRTTDTIAASDIEYQHIENTLDSVLTMWEIRQHRSEKKNTDNQGKQASPNIPDSIYLDRLNKIPSIMNLSYNKIVRRYIEVYTCKKRDQVAAMLGLAEYYFPFFEQVLDAHNLPIELRYLPVIESALNPRARSWAGATGLWQFMFYTAKLFKLEMNSYVDERCDPEKSTYAAVQYLTMLYKEFKDWTLVIAAYNCGPGNVKKAIRRSGGKKGYWDIYYYLPRETRGYVPAFIGATYAMNYYDKHGIVPIRLNNTENDTIKINRNLHFEQVSEILDIPMGQLRELNPQYKHDIIPGNESKSYTLRLPADKTLDFIDLEDSVYAYKDSVLFDKKPVVKAKPRYSRKYTYSPPPVPKGKAKVYYTVQPGDNVGFISEWYDVGASQLRHWNRIYRNRIYAGKKLVVYVPKDKVGYYKKINSMSYKQKMALIGKAPEQNNNLVSQNTSDEDEFIYYKIKRGENLWTIAKKFPGVSNIDIMKLNDLDFEEVKNLKPGQVLKIRKKG